MMSLEDSSLAQCFCILFFLSQSYFEVLKFIIGIPSC